MDKFTLEYSKMIEKIGKRLQKSRLILETIDLKKADLKNTGNIIVSLETGETPEENAKTAEEARVHGIESEYFTTSLGHGACRLTTPIINRDFLKQFVLSSYTYGDDMKSKLEQIESALLECCFNGDCANGFKALFSEEIEACGYVVRSERQTSEEAKKLEAKLHELGYVDDGEDYLTKTFSDGSFISFTRVFEADADHLGISGYGNLVRVKAPSQDEDVELDDEAAHDLATALENTLNSCLLALDGEDIFKPEDKELLETLKKDLEALTMAI